MILIKTDQDPSHPWPEHSGFTTNLPFCLTHTGREASRERATRAMLCLNAPPRSEHFVPLYLRSDLSFHCFVGPRIQSDGDDEKIRRNLGQRGGSRPKYVVCSTCSWFVSCWPQTTCEKCRTPRGVLLKKINPPPGVGAKRVLHEINLMTLETTGRLVGWFGEGAWEAELTTCVFWK